MDEVVFEEGVHTIAFWFSAFYKCSALTKVLLPATLRQIVDFAFQQRSRLTSIDIPMGLKVIAQYAFKTTGLLHLEVPATVERIGKFAFRRFQQLEPIVQNHC